MELKEKMTKLEEKMEEQEKRVRKMNIVVTGLDEEECENQWRLVRGGRYGSADPEIYLKRTQFKTVHLYFFFKQVSSFISL
jgi:hypothetical protein